MMHSNRPGTAATSANVLQTGTGQRPCKNLWGLAGCLCLRLSPYSSLVCSMASSHTGQLGMILANFAGSCPALTKEPSWALKG